jgi:hypothetical protein
VHYIGINFSRMMRDENYGLAALAGYGDEVIQLNRL